MSPLHERQHSSKTSRPLLASKVDMCFTKEGSKAETYLSYVDVKLLNSVKIMIIFLFDLFSQILFLWGIVGKML